MGHARKKTSFRHCRNRTLLSEGKSARSRRTWKQSAKHSPFSRLPFPKTAEGRTLLVGRGEVFYTNACKETPTPWRYLANAGIDNAEANRAFSKIGFSDRYAWNFASD